MVTGFVILLCILAAVPIVTVIFALVHRHRVRKRAANAHNHPITTTTMHQGPNGRTVFESRSTRPGPGPRSPILPYTQQQSAKVHQAPRKNSMKNAWNRLSRPFSVAPEPVHVPPPIQVPPKTKQVPYKSKFTELLTPTEPEISPITVRHFKPTTNTSHTIDPLSPVSPISSINIRASTSATGHILSGYTHPQNPPAIAGVFHNIPLTPPVHTVKKGTPIFEAPRRAPIPGSQPIRTVPTTSFNSHAKASAQTAGSQALNAGVAYAARRYAPANTATSSSSAAAAAAAATSFIGKNADTGSSSIKRNVVDAGRKNVKQVYIAKPPRTKARGRVAMAPVGANGKVRKNSAASRVKKGGKGWI